MKYMLCVKLTAVLLKKVWLASGTATGNGIFGNQNYGISNS